MRRERPIKVRFLADGSRAKSYIYDAYGYPEVQPGDFVEVPGGSVARVVALGHRYEWSGPLTTITGLFKIERRTHHEARDQQLDRRMWLGIDREDIFARLDDIERRIKDYATDRSLMAETVELVRDVERQQRDLAEWAENHGHVKDLENMVLRHQQSLELMLKIFESMKEDDDG